MFSIQIRVDEGKKEELLEALNGLRQNIDFEFQAADEQHKQSVTDPGTDESGRGTQRGYSSKPLNIALLNVF